MSLNPYQAPSALVEDYQSPAVSGDLLETPRARPAAHGWRWLVEGWRLVRRNPWKWMGVCGVLAGVFVGLSLLPFLGAIVQDLITPLLIGGLMLGCDALRRREPLKFSHLFAGFLKSKWQLLLLGVLYLAINLMLSPIMFIVGLRIFTPPDSEIIARILLFAGLALAVILPLLMLMLFASALVMLHDKKLLDAVRLSFVAFKRNLRPLLVYGLFVGPVLVAIGNAPSFLSWLVAGPPIFVGAITNLPSFLACVIFGPLIIASLYAGYRDLFIAE